MFKTLADGTLVPLRGETDWARLAAMTDAEIEAGALADEDNPPLTEAQWQMAVASRR